MRVLSRVRSNKDRASTEAIAWRLLSVAERWINTVKPTMVRMATKSMRRLISISRTVTPAVFTRIDTTLCSDFRTELLPIEGGLPGVPIDVLLDTKRGLPAGLDELHSQTIFLVVKLDEIAHPSHNFDRIVLPPVF